MIDRPDDGGFVDGIEKGTERIAKEGQKELDTRNEQNAKDADARRELANQNADDLQKNADELSKDAKASSHTAQTSADVNEAQKLHADAADAQVKADGARAGADALPEGKDIPKLELPDGLKTLNKAAAVLGPIGDAVQLGVGAYDANTQYQAGQNHDAAVTAGKTVGAVAGGGIGAAGGALIGFAAAGPPGAIIGGLAGAYLGDKAGGSAGEEVADIIADRVGIENKNPIEEQ